jgi:hypothetical protein
MGLDLIVEGCSKPGHEAEWRRIVQRLFKEDTLTDEDTARFQDISIPAYERLGAPRVGYDKAADAWIIKTRGATTPEETAEVLKKFHGYYALALVKSDGIPAFSHSGLTDAVDETSFRGSALSQCREVLSKALIERAWSHQLPEAAVAYGQALLEAADAAESGPRPPPPKPSLLARLGLLKQEPPEPLEDQLDIVRTAGRWFIFWGERGHAIQAWC